MRKGMPKSRLMQILKARHLRSPVDIGTDSPRVWTDRWSFVCVLLKWFINLRLVRMKIIKVMETFCAWSLFVKDLLLTENWLKWLGVDRNSISYVIIKKYHPHRYDPTLSCSISISLSAGFVPSKASSHQFLWTDSGACWIPSCVYLLRLKYSERKSASRVQIFTMWLIHTWKKNSFASTYKHSLHIFKF